MTKHVFVALLMMVVVVGSIQAQGLQQRRSLGGRSLQCQMDSAEFLASATNESERAQIEQRIKNGELPEPLIPIEEALALAEKGEGKLILLEEDRGAALIKKFDSSGMLVFYGTEWDDKDCGLEELKWILAEKEKVVESRCDAWAKEHGMTLDEVMAKYAKRLHRRNLRLVQETKEEMQESLKRLREVKAAAAAAKRW